MHGQVEEFLRKVWILHPKAFAGKIVELGSLDINGTPRRFFQAKEYVGIDWRQGPNVTDVCLAHKYEGKPDGYFDFAISTEMLEHDPHWRKSVAKMARLIRPGGSLLVTCAAPGRPRHEVETSPEKDYYEPVAPKDLLACLLEHAAFQTLVIETSRKPHDTRLFAYSKLEG